MKRIEKPKVYRNHVLLAHLSRQQAGAGKHGQKPVKTQRRQANAALRQNPDAF